MEERDALTARRFLSKATASHAVRGIGEAQLAAIGGGLAAPVMIATASDIENSDGSMTAILRPRRCIWMRSATSNT